MERMVISKKIMNSKQTKNEIKMYTTYKIRKPNKSKLKSIEMVEGETIEQKVERIHENNEPITAEAPELYTERKDGVIAGYNIRTDRWELAADSMDILTKNKLAKREGTPEHKEKIDQIEKKKAAEKAAVKEQLKIDAINDGKPVSVQGKQGE